MTTSAETALPQVLLAHHLKTLKLPTFLREYDKQAQLCAAEGIDHSRFPAVKSLDSFDFTAIPSLNKMLVLDLARCDYITRRENVIALGNSGTGKTHTALALRLAACRFPFSASGGSEAFQIGGVATERLDLPWDSEFTVYMYTLMQAAPNMPIATSPGPMLMVRGGGQKRSREQFRCRELHSGHGGRVHGDIQAVL
ncbi:transposase [Magnetospirillum gryphiswaldense MSR-1 v2]|uniref:Transposase n=1 Tax=Magnetospirillum gryphiswaldense (strain DSM 6361 / JCM 21280 / NBRC 15271 / MSR-1) TaxID=431944 RepID=V6F5G7_MAGGM|nr:ATP-binding protein [Magnetospirillum gryphiswaldense]CDK99551.1 transposase [Magnetospirillum gryphiswaldense MSR-1 v2]